MIKKIFLTISIFASFILFTGRTSAEELVVSGNGEGSQNQINVTSSSTNNVAQTNNAEVQNNVDAKADTGSNEASSNTGDVSIATGDVEELVSIENKLNASFAETNCCGSSFDTDLTITQNGADSQNSINLNQTNNTNVFVSQTANVENNVNGNANTGGNSANNNSSNASIQTGNIYVNENIQNKYINISDVKAGAGIGGDIYISIFSNGAGSLNNINFNLARTADVRTDYLANIFNYSKWDLNTGGNSANGNLGNVSIATGDINFTSTIENGPINVGGVDVSCCSKEDDDPDDPDDPPTPPIGGVNPPTATTTSGGGGDGKSDGKGGSVLSAATGQILAATGGMWLYLITLAGIMMFLMGWYLRLTSGNSPPKFLFA